MMVSFSRGRERAAKGPPLTIPALSFPPVKQKRGDTVFHLMASRIALFLPHAQTHVVRMTRESEIFHNIKIDMTSC
jgi:hypothetical protein